MENTQAAKATESGLRQSLIYLLGLVFVFVGLLNVTPSIPGWDDGWKAITGWDGMKVRRFPTEWLYPIVFFCMMVIVALKQSIYVSWRDRGAVRRAVGLFMDIALVVAAATISVTYMTELEAICIIDQFTGDRARLIA